MLDEAVQLAKALYQQEHGHWVHIAKILGLTMAAPGARATMVMEGQQDGPPESLLPP